MGNTIIEGARILYSATFSLDGLKVEAESENINNLPGIDIMMIIITVSLIIHVIFNSHSGFFGVKSIKWINKIQALERLVNENKKNTQTQTEEFSQDPAAIDMMKLKKGVSRLLENQPTLIYLVTIQDLPADKYLQGYREIKWTLTGILNLKRFKRVGVLYSIVWIHILNSWATQNSYLPRLEKIGNTNIGS